MKKNGEPFIEKHLAFILTIIVTYVIGVLIVFAQYFIDRVNNIESNIWELLVEAMVPTTITYLFGCVMVNLVEIIQNRVRKCTYNIFTCVVIFGYVFVFFIYLLCGFSFGWLIAEFLLTVGILILNVFCYREKYSHRNHGLV